MNKNLKNIELICTTNLSEIYKADDLIRQKKVIIKKLRKPFIYDRQAIALLQSEVETLIELKHPNIVEAYEFISEENLHIGIFEYIEGKTLADFLIEHQNQQKQIPISEAINIIKQLASALSYIHQSHLKNQNIRTLFHGDLNPKNILLTQDLKLKLIDFSLKQCEEAVLGPKEGLGRGVLSYLSPEQLLGLPFDERSDLFSVGILFWELINLKPLFDFEEKIKVYQSITQINFSSENLPGLGDKKVKELICSCLKQKATSRISSAQEFFNRLKEINN